tara:strand:- start:33 stop:491 length:459 start_codon:yes stop_codon:yes gene_type:complete
MKKLTLILLLIPILNNSQTLKDFCFIDSIDLFKRYATEYNYEKVTENDDYISYALDPIGKDFDTMKSKSIAMYMPKTNIVSWGFGMEFFIQQEIYNAMYNYVKGDGKYLKINDVGGTDYVTYEIVCHDGKGGSSSIQLGFAITDGIGTIIRF